MTYGTNGSFAANVYSSPQGTGAITKQYSGTTPNVVFATGLQLWDTDGTAGGTQQLDISGASSTGINPRQITVSGRLAIFEGASPAGEQVWASDGTSTGTVELTSLTPNAYVSILPAQPNGKVLFTVTVGSTYNQLGVTDGTAAGTKLLSYGGKPIASVYDATVIQGGALFYASIGAGTSLWFTNGTEAGTNELTPAAIPYNPVGDLTPIGALDYFVAGTTNNAFTSVSELWSTGGTSAGTAPLAGSAGLNPIDLVNVDGTLLFSSNGQTWSVDTNGPYKLGPIANAAASGFKIANITPFGNDALFVALDAQAHEELWITDGTSYGTTELTSPMLNGAAANIGASSLVVSGSHAFFEGVDKTGAESLWVTDGTPGGTHDLSLLPSSGGTSIQPLDLTSFDGGVLFDAFDNTYRDGELWYSDGTVAGSIQLSAVGNYFGTDEGLSPNDITVVGNAALFQGTDGQADVGLWSTDGTAAGTQEISLVSATALSRIAGSINVACYARGTFILTPAGEVLVENLTSDRRVVTHDGRVCQVRWIGRRSYAGQSLAANQGLHPIVFRSGSLGGGLPRRDLLVSPLHAMFIDGVLIPAQALVNGTTIVREHGLDRIDYFHVELDQHDVLLAEGAPSETFLDDNSRRTFENASEYSALYPNPTMPRGYCAPRVESGPVLAAIRQRLEGIGVQEVRIESDGTHTVPIRDGVRALRLITASGHVPGDARRLGAAIGRIAIDGLNLPLDDMRLATGWHDCEERWRWTDGGALMLVAGAREIEVTLVSFPFALAA